MTELFRNKMLSEIFERDGYVIVDFLNDAELQYLLAVHKSFAGNLKRDFEASIMSTNEQYRRVVDREVKKIFVDKIMALLCGYRLSSCGYVVKKSQSPESELPIHQDWSFVDETQYLSLGLWCPLGDVKEQNGCIRLIKGSHKFNSMPRGQSTPPAYRSFFSALRPSAFTDLRMKAGQALLQSHRLFHGSRSNLSPLERVATYGILLPEESRPLFYYQDLNVNPPKLEVFEVDDEFFTKYVPGTRPVGYKSRGFIDYEFEPITEKQIANTLVVD